MSEGHITHYMCDIIEIFVGDNCTIVLKKTVDMHGIPNFQAGTRNLPRRRFLIIII